jgi:transposase
MIGPPSGTRIWLVAGQTDLRKGVDGLSSLVQTHLNANPFTGEVYLFRGKCRISCERTHLISSEWDHPISG